MHVAVGLIDVDEINVEQTSLSVHVTFASRTGVITLTMDENVALDLIGTIHDAVYGDQEREDPAGVE